MNKRDTGNISGSHYQLLELTDLIITDTAYTLEKVDWHYHENPYFTFLLQGKMKEVGTQTTHYCVPGTLLFHHPGDAHYNLRQPEFTRGFHIEVKSNFFSRHQLPFLPFGSSETLSDPALKLLFRRLYIQQKLHDTITPLAFEELLLHFFGSDTIASQKETMATPLWVKKVKTALHELPAGTLTWAQLADLANVHPVYLSRAFPKYFHCTASDYLRRLRLESAVNQLTVNPNAVHHLAHQYGFADQSHFIRWFRSTIGVTPKTYQKIISQG